MAENPQAARLAEELMDAAEAQSLQRIGHPWLLRKAADRLAALVVECDAQRTRIQELEAGDSRLSAAVVVDDSEEPWTWVCYARSLHGDDNPRVMPYGEECTACGAHHYVKLTCICPGPCRLRAQEARPVAEHPSRKVQGLEAATSAAVAEADRLYVAVRWPEIYLTWRWFNDGRSQEATDEFRAKVNASIDEALAAMEVTVVRG